MKAAPIIATFLLAAGCSLMVMVIDPIFGTGLFSVVVGAVLLAKIAT